MVDYLRPDRDLNFEPFAKGLFSPGHKLDESIKYFPVGCAHIRGLEVTVQVEVYKAVNRGLFSSAIGGMAQRLELAHWSFTTEYATVESRYVHHFLIGLVADASLRIQLVNHSQVVPMVQGRNHLEWLRFRHWYSRVADVTSPEAISTRICSC
jgi:hypothetical protein